MADIERTKQLNVSRTLREARDAGLDSLAKVVLSVTSSGTYARATSALAKPGLVVAGVARRRTKKVMSRLLSKINMPSRTDVLALSTRLTHIEMTLDDLSAAVDSMRAPAVRSPAKRAANSRGAQRAAAAQEG
jgi:hypothetical protein